MLAEPFLIPGAVLARPAQDSWPGCGEARGCCRGRLREDVRWLLSRARTRSILFPPFWLEHAAPTPPLGSRRTDTAVNRGRRPSPPARCQTRLGGELGTTRHRLPHWGGPRQSELLLTSHLSWRDGQDTTCCAAACGTEHPPSPVAVAPTKPRLPPGCTGHSTELLFGAFAGPAAEPSVGLPAWE